jgi:hypothetical protein
MKSFKEMFISEETDIEDFSDDAAEMLFEGMAEFIIELPDKSVPDEMKESYNKILGLLDSGTSSDDDEPDDEGD